MAAKVASQSPALYSLGAPWMPSRASNKAVLSVLSYHGQR